MLTYDAVENLNRTVSMILVDNESYRIHSRDMFASMAYIARLRLH
jgi:hypothetical protein